MVGKKYKQREYMRKLILTLGKNKSAVCAAYVQAERDVLVRRRSNYIKKTPEKYADSLWLDGEIKGWF